MGEQVVWGNIMEERYAGPFYGDNLAGDVLGEMSLEDVAGETLLVETMCHAMATLWGEASFWLLADVVEQGGFCWYNY